jgi:outer membrane murein-binding lipoprotein Lpp
MKSGVSSLAEDIAQVETLRRELNAKAETLRKDHSSLSSDEQAYRDEMLRLLAELDQKLACLSSLAMTIAESKGQA